MSLLLRKACQPALNDLGLSGLHVIINHSKNLTIVGECGQQIIVVQGIQFNGTVPKTVELAYATELFSAYLTKYKTKILDYIKVKKAFKLLTKPKLPQKSTTEYHYGWTIQSPAVRFTDRKANITFTFYIKAETYISVSGIVKDTKIALKEIPKLKKVADKYFREEKIYVAAQTEVLKLSTELNSCNI